MKKMSIKSTTSDSIIDIEEIADRFRKFDGSEVVVLPVDSSTVKDLRTRLQSWYGENRRMLPWRGDEVDGISAPNVSAYGIWVSEIMLQQTRVETVIPYWRRWMERFPTIEALAKATPDEVNALWAGLGYYRRAQQLLKGAQTVVADFGGKVPDTAEELKKIPGVGPYTAGAISSIAFGKAEPLVDGNVIRVLSRLFVLQEVQGTSAMDKQCWSLAGTLVDPTSPGAFNQALMELGATVCKPTSPSCDICPVNMHCKAKALVEYSTSSAKREDCKVLSHDMSVAECKEEVEEGVEEGMGNDGEDSRKALGDGTKTKNKIKRSLVAEDKAQDSLRQESNSTKKRRITKKEQHKVASSSAVADDSPSPDDVGIIIDTDTQNDTGLSTEGGLPLSISYFPRKLAKNKPREIVLSVCVLATRDIDPNVDYYLFIRRPGSGLLANQWEFPSVVLWEELQAAGGGGARSRLQTAAGSSKVAQDKGKKKVAAIKIEKKSTQVQVQEEEGRGSHNGDDDDFEMPVPAPRGRKTKPKATSAAAAAAAEPDGDDAITQVAVLNSCENEGEEAAAVKPPDDITVNDLWKPFPSFLLDTMGVQWYEAFPPDAKSSKFAKGRSSSSTAEPSGAQLRIVPAAGNEATTFKSLGPLVHVFSHQRHTMHVLHRHVNLLQETDGKDNQAGSQQGNTSAASKKTVTGSRARRASAAPVTVTEPTKSDVHNTSLVAVGGSSSWSSLCGGNRQIKWMTHAQLLEAGVTTACKKVLLSVADKRHGSGGSKKWCQAPIHTCVQSRSTHLRYILISQHRHRKFGSAYYYF